MNLKNFTLSIVFLFFIGNTSAQGISAPTSDIADITLSVRDILGTQEFVLETDSVQHFTPGNQYGFRILLNYESELRNISYFRLIYSFDIPNFSGTPAAYQALMLGTTVPVIIPPIKKNIVSEYRPSGEQYPHTIISLVPLFPRNYSVTITLCRFDTLEDYLADNGNCTESSSVVYALKLYRTSGLLPNESYTVTTYPNPSKDHVIIEYTNTTTNHVPLGRTPIQLTVFNKEGIKVSTHTVVSSKTKKNSVFYNFDTSHLAKGMYFFEIKDGKKTQVKTIIKE